MTRDLARGLLPVVADARGLMSALERWAGEVSELFHVSCRFECNYPVLVEDETLADHLYRLTQEAVNNAIKHGHARNIIIRLAPAKTGASLSIRDDGCGFERSLTNDTGLGLRIMNYRAKKIGGFLDVISSPNDGTVVSCVFPITDLGDGEYDAR
jgi:signal transduction histidine kinase